MLIIQFVQSKMVFLIKIPRGKNKHFVVNNLAFKNRLIILRLEMGNIFVFFRTNKFL